MSSPRSCDVPAFGLRMLTSGKSSSSSQPTPPANATRSPSPSARCMTASITSASAPRNVPRSHRPTSGPRALRIATGDPRLRPCADPSRPDAAGATDLNACPRPSEPTCALEQRPAARAAVGGGADAPLGAAPAWLTPTPSRPAAGSAAAGRAARLPDAARPHAATAGPGPLTRRAAASRRRRLVDGGPPPDAGARPDRGARPIVVASDEAPDDAEPPGPRRPIWWPAPGG